MVGKRGQATIFIILGIVLVVIVVLLFTTKTIELPRRFVESSQTSNVDAYVEQCVGQELKEIFVGLKKQGGMIYPGAYHWYNGVPYFYIVENNGGQFAKHIEDEFIMDAYISDYVEKLLKQGGVCDPCSKFGDLSGCGNFDVTVISNEENIIINAKNDNLVMKKGDSYVDVGELSLLIEDDFFRGYKIVKKIADENMNAEWFDVYDYLLKQLDSDVHIKVIGSPVANENIKLFYVWLEDGTEEEAFYFAIKK